MKKFALEYDGKTIEDAGAYLSEDFKSLARKFKNALKREFPEFEVLRYMAGHYCLSGFLERNGIYIYFSWNVQRFGYPINTKDSGVTNGVMYRTAANAFDFTGGHNNFCSVESMGKSVRILYDKEKTFRDKGGERGNGEELSI